MLPLDGEPASLMQATKHGTGLMSLEFPPFNQPQQGWNDPRQAPARGACCKPSGKSLQQGVCQCANHMKYELGLAAMAMADRGLLQGRRKGQVPEELIGQAIKEVTMHEVGHTLGLRHNFKASTMLKNEQLHDTDHHPQARVWSARSWITPRSTWPPRASSRAITSPPPSGLTTTGRLNTPISRSPAAPTARCEELKKIANRGAGAGLDYATDEDMYGAADPLINVWDLGNDPMKFAAGPHGCWPRSCSRAWPTASWTRATATSVSAWRSACCWASTATRRIWRRTTSAASRCTATMRGDPNGRDPFVPVKAAKQREALKFLQDHILTDKPFQFSPQLLRRLAADRWRHWGNEGAVYGRRRIPGPPARAADSAAGADARLRPGDCWPASRTTP